MPAAPDPSDDLVAQLVRVSAEILGHYEASAARVGLSAQEAQLLFILGTNPVSMLGLTQSLRAPKSTMTSVMTRMERQGLVARRRSGADGRQVLSRATEEGVAASHRFERDLAGRVTPMLAALDDAERAELAELLTELLVRLP